MLHHNKLVIAFLFHKKCSNTVGVRFKIKPSSQSPKTIFLYQIRFRKKQYPLILPKEKPTFVNKKQSEHF